MKKPIVYTDEPIQLGRIVEDFLPPPEVFGEYRDSVKVTLALSQRSIDFFKREAARHNTPYQRMIRRLLDAYAAMHTDKAEEPKARYRGGKKKARAR